MQEKQINNVADIIDIEYLQNIQDNLGNLVGITTVLLDPNGIPITQPTNLFAFCEMMQASDTGVLMCIKANSQLARINIKTRVPAIVTCPNSGLKTAAVPIFLDEKYLGSWLIGQIRMDDVDYDLIEKTAARAGLPKEKAKQNISMLPIITAKEFDHILRFLVTITKALTDMVKVNNELRKEEERVAYLAYHDQALEIANAMKLENDLKAISGQSTYMICFDIQGLHVINDVYGRDWGDLLLKCITDWIQSQITDNMELYRIDGDDFVLLVRNCAWQNVQSLAAALYDRFENSWEIKKDNIKQKLFAGVHMGIIEYSSPFDTLSAMRILIERVLNFARTENELVFFDEQKNEAVQKLLQFEVSLKSCILNNMQGFDLNYQPIVDAHLGRWIGLEALCRFTSPDIGPVHPDIFIAQAEQNGLIGFISDWVFEQSIRQVKEWHLDLLPNFILDVNLSPLQLRDQDLPQKVERLLQLYDYPAQKLTLEITESSEVHFDQKTLLALENIKKTGVSLSLDDFGVGYASFSSLKNIPVSTLKTDRSFVTDIEKDTFSQHTFRVMTDFAQAVGLSVIAEGVETESQRILLEKYGIRLIQGYYFSKPLSKEVLSRQLHHFQKDG